MKDNTKEFIGRMAEFALQSLCSAMAPKIVEVVEKRINERKAVKPPVTPDVFRS